jgi:hypothetical protein
MTYLGGFKTALTKKLAFLSQGMIFQLARRGAFSF